MIIHYDLFAGIGGFSYALDQVFYDQEIEHIFCEWEAFPTAVLKKHWPDATYYGDIADLVADTGRKHGQSRTDGSDREATIWASPADETKRLVIVTGGFPCQPFSHAGRRQGTADNRYKWPEMFAVIRNVRPNWVIAENVRGLVTWNDGMVLETVCADLESEGYEVQPLVIPACAVGAPHRRDRVWIVAHAIDSRQGREKQGSIGTPDSVSAEHREKDSTTWEFERADSDGKVIRPATNTTNPGIERMRGSSELSNRSWEVDWREVAFTTCHDGVDDGLPRRMDGATSRGRGRNQISASLHRKLRLKACGNAIVPQVAMQIFNAIKEG